jgi:hypothetical protein
VCCQILNTVRDIPPRCGHDLAIPNLGTVSETQKPANRVDSKLSMRRSGTLRRIGETKNMDENIPNLEITKGYIVCVCGAGFTQRSEEYEDSVKRGKG